MGILFPTKSYHRETGTHLIVYINTIIFYIWSFLKLMNMSKYASSQLSNGSVHAVSCIVIMIILTLFLNNLWTLHRTNSEGKCSRIILWTNNEAMQKQHRSAVVYNQSTKSPVTWWRPTAPCTSQLTTASCLTKSQSGSKCCLKPNITITAITHEMYWAYHLLSKWPEAKQEASDCVHMALKKHNCTCP